MVKDLIYIIVVIQMLIKNICILDFYQEVEIRMVIVCHVVLKKINSLLKILIKKIIFWNVLEKKKDKKKKIINIDKIYILQDSNKIHEGKFAFLPKKIDEYFNLLQNNSNSNKKSLP